MNAVKTLFALAILLALSATSASASLITDLLNGQSLRMDYEGEYSLVLDNPSSGDDVGCVDSGGDFNGDGVDDLVVGAPEYKSGRGGVFVVWGRSDFGGNYNQGRPSLDLKEIAKGNSSKGVVFTGPEGSGFGTSCDGGENVDGDSDNTDDIVVGAPDGHGDSHGFSSNTGIAVVLFGRKSPSSFTVKKDSDDRLQVLYGSDSWGGDAGKSVSLIPDMTRDGRAEIAVGDPDYDRNGDNDGKHNSPNCDGPHYGCGATFVVYGKARHESLLMIVGDDGGLFDRDSQHEKVKDLDGSGKHEVKTMIGNKTGFAIHGSEAHANLGWSLAGGDFDGDGIGDVAVGAPGDGPQRGTGKAFVVRGTGEKTGKEINTARDDTRRMIGNVTGPAKYALAGYSVSAVDDIDGDNKDELAVGAPQAQARGVGQQSGITYVLPGRTLVSGQERVLGNGSTEAATINGEASKDLLGASLSNAGDLDQDGKGDLLVGAPSSDNYPLGIKLPLPENGGAAYIIYGKSLLNENGLYAELSTEKGDSGSYSRLAGTNKNDQLGGIAQRQGAGHGIMSWLFERFNWDYDKDKRVRYNIYQSHDRLVSGGGDNNGDGEADIFVGAPGYEGAGSREDSGGSFLVLGSSIDYQGSSDISYAQANSMAEHPLDGGIPGLGNPVRYISFEVGEEFEWAPSMTSVAQLPPDDSSSAISGAQLGLDFGAILSGGGTDQIALAEQALTNKFTNVIDELKSTYGYVSAVTIERVSAEQETFLPNNVNFSMSTGSIFSRDGDGYNKTTCDDVGTYGPFKVSLSTPAGTDTEFVMFSIAANASCNTTATATQTETTPTDTVTSASTSTDSSVSTSSSSGSSSGSSGGTTTTTNNVTVNNYGDFTLTLSGVSTQAALQRRRVYLYAKCSQACKLTAKGKVRGLTVKSKSRSAEANQRRLLSFTLSKKVRKKIKSALKRHKKVTVKLTVTATKSDGTQVSKTRSIRVRR